jgi:putative ABC transport system substrate-binding protein
VACPRSSGRVSLDPTGNNAFRQGLRDHGYIEGQNIVIEHRISSAPNEQPALLADLIERKVDVIFTWSTPA